MSNWLADPVACAIRLKDERGCNILAGRNEVMSRSTICSRTEEADGDTYWRWGHLYAKRTEDARGNPRIVGGSHGANVNHTTETAAMELEHANVLSDLLRAAYANNGGHSCGGKSLYEMLWDEMKTIYERLATGQEAEDGRDPGRAEGMAYALAVMQNPYRPSVDAVREQLVEWWDTQESEPEPPKPSRAAARKARRARA